MIRQIGQFVRDGRQYVVQFAHPFSGGVGTISPLDGHRVSTGRRCARCSALLLVSFSQKHMRYEVPDWLKTLLRRPPLNPAYFGRFWRGLVEPFIMRSYALAADLHRQGGIYLRPWHLVYSSESGVKGFVEEDSWLKAVLWMFHFRTAMLGFWSDFGFFVALRTCTCNWHNSCLHTGTSSNIMSCYQCVRQHVHCCIDYPSRRLKPVYKSSS